MRNNVGDYVFNKINGIVGLRNLLVHDPNVNSLDEPQRQTFGASYEQVMYMMNVEKVILQSTHAVFTIIT